MKRLIALLLLLPLSAYSQTLQGSSGSAFGSATFSGPISVPLGSASAPSILPLGASTNTGFYIGGGNPAISNSGNSMISVQTTTVRINGSASVGFVNGVADSNPPDTGISRRSATIIAIGNGTAGNTAGGYVTGTASLVSLTTGTNADFLCLAADGTVLLQNAACTISSLRFKPDWKPYQDDAAAKVAKFDVGTFHVQTGPNSDPNASSLQAGLSAESVAAIAPECAIYENDMKTPKSYRQECVIALLVKAIQQIKMERK